jgi:predicted GIY-YIG superfamily endonuclease
LYITMDAKERWSYIPAEFRGWWVERFNHVVLGNPDNEDDRVTLFSPPPKFKMGERDVKKMNEALKDLRWQTLHLVLDSYVSYPTVRCPWGCSEFIHLCNRLPFEDYLSFKSNWCFKTTTKDGIYWVTGTKPSFPDNALVLENPDFLVAPTLVIDPKDGLCILCCQNHTKKSTAKYLHVPDNPLGSIYSPESDRYAQVQLQSRTLRKTKQNVYSDTYQTNILMGGYDGLDSCYLTKSTRQCMVNYATTLRNYLYISGRSDIRCYVAQLSQDKGTRTYLPQRDVDQLLKLSREHFPDVAINASSETEGSTFVSLEDAVSVQEHIYNEGTQVLLVIPHNDYDDTGGNDSPPREEFFRPPWPNFFLKVHPMGGHGEQFPRISDPYKSFVAWSVIAAVACVPLVWSASAKGIKNSVDRIGYLVACAWNIIKGGKGTSSSSKTVFFAIGGKKKGVVFNLLGFTHRRDHLELQTEVMFGNIPHIRVIHESSGLSRDVPEDIKAVIWSSDSTINWTEWNEYATSSEQRWEAVLVVCKDSRCRRLDARDSALFCRHGGSLNPKWWLQGGEKKQFSRIKNFPPAPFTRCARLIVLIPTSNSEQLHITERYLRLLGGQTRCFCNNHRQLLILNPASKTSSLNGQRLCCLAHDDANHQICNKPALFVCGRTSCDIGVCEQHFKTVISTEETYAFLSRGKVLSKTKPQMSYFYINHKFDDDSDSGTASSTSHHTNDTTTSAAPSACSHASNSADALFHGKSKRTGEDESEHEISEIIVEAMGPTEPLEFPLDLLLEEENEENSLGLPPDLLLEEQNEDIFPGHAGTREINNFHCTLASREPLHLVLDEGKDVPAAPLHVLLNSQGHLLVRQNAKLRLSRRHASFFQGIAANAPRKTFPLAYAEAMLKPSIFYMDLPDGTIPGAIPTGLWADNAFLKKLGIASMREHITTRIQNPALLCSTDTQYHFLLLDKLINLGMRGNDSRLILHRGLAESQKNEGASFRTKEGNEELRGENVEDQSNVHKLAALIAESPPDYFYTQSCNQTTCPGVRKIRQWVTSDQGIFVVATKYKVSYEEASNLLRAAAAPYIHRTWNEIVSLWMRYIIYSQQEPLHTIEWAWYRKEFQDENGNPSHIHAILKTKIDTSTEYGNYRVLKKIRGSIADLFHHSEMLEMKAEGIVDSLDVFGDILHDAERFLTHRCHSRCQIPKMSPSGETFFACKAPSNWLLTPEPHRHTMQEVEVVHTENAQKILADLDLGCTCPHGSGKFIITHPLLKAVRHVPICSAQDGKFSPTSGDLFIRMPSASNLQKTTGHTVAMYLTSYVAEIDKVSMILIKPPSANEDQDLKAHHQSLNNTKINSVRYYNQQKMRAIVQKTQQEGDSSRKKGKKQYTPPVGRPITHMEALSVLTKDVLVTSTRQFIHMPTCAREYRSALYTGYLKSHTRPQDLQAILAVIGQTVRIELRFPPHRMFTGPQMKVIIDELQAPLRTDSTTYFSMRPPELLFLREQKLYITWFNRDTTTCPLFDPEKAMATLKKFLHRDFARCCWMDGFNHTLLLRRKAIEPCLAYADASPTCNFGVGTAGIATKKATVALLIRINFLYKIYGNDWASTHGRDTPSRYADWLNLSGKFLSPHHAQHLPVIWCTPIYPRRKTAFLVQLLLQKGSFTTEYELMQSGSLKQAYEMAGLFDPSQPELSTLTLLKRFVLENLRSYPGSTYQFDRNLCEASIAIRDLFSDSGLSVAPCPSVLFSHMIEETDQKIDTYIRQERSRLIDSICEDLQRCGYGDTLPDKDRILNARSANALSDEECAAFYPPPPIHGRQNLASYKEQKNLFLLAQKCFSDYTDPSTPHRNVVVSGGPGVGKTTVCQFITLFLLSKGLNVTPTSLVADRSKQLGGTHFHRLLSLKGDSTACAPGKQAERAIRDLYKKPEKLGFLKTLDAINLDELGVFSAESIAIFDMVLRYVRRSSDFMGGLFVYCTMDHLQLLPFTGTPALLSLYVINEFMFVQLEESVRASNCPALREIGKLTRTTLSDDEDKKRLSELLTQHCIFVPDFHDPSIPEEAVFVFGRKAPCREAENLMLNRMRILHAGSIMESLATDEESTTGGDWRGASNPTSKRLNSTLRRSSLLLLYPNARFEFTNNEKHFNQGQLALLIDVPDDNTISNQLPIEMWKSPTGEKNFPPLTHCTKEGLRLQGWSPTKVGFSTTAPKLVSRGIQGRRSQYPLRPRVASTIHACMGSTLQSVVTSLVSNNSGLDFSLWEAAQVVVLLSRTEYANKIFFVGDREATIHHIIQVLGKPHRFLQQISDLLRTLFQETARSIGTVPIQGPDNTATNDNSQDNQPMTSFVQNTYFRPCDSVIGQAKAVYLLVSTRDTSFSYIGQTDRLGRRLFQHNTGNGARVTSNPALLPWAVMAYVVGFRTKNEREHFERLWKLTARRRHCSSMDHLISVASDLTQELNFDLSSSFKLRLVTCGTLMTRMTQQIRH